MRAERKKVGYDLRRSSKYSLEGAISHLKEKIFNPEQAYYEFPIKNNITQDILQTLLTLPYEVAITGSTETLILLTGTKNTVGGGDGYVHRRDHSRTSFHTHPFVNNEVPLLCPSFSDIWISEFASKKTTLGLAHPDGVMIYGKPIFDPDTHISCEDDEARDVLLRYCVKRGVDFFGTYSSLKKICDLTQLEKVELQTTFCKETGVIVDEASWTDQEGVERVMSRIFGTPI